mmetsp:Transcript_25979/g.68170  ORF Transcript_25979/g.68170 Transcript_25979/m.68170 type:complete len:378 (+) Transcript_25979:517-1650(+)
MAARFTFLSANDAACPPRTSFTGIRLLWIPLKATCWKFPTLSGPSSMVSAAVMVPHTVVPDTTVPTPGTENVSSIWNTAGASVFAGLAGRSRFMNDLSRSRFSPVTFDTWKIGHSRCPRKFFEASITSSSLFTSSGILRHPADLRIFWSSLRVAASTFGGHMSILVITTNTGLPSANVRPRCSLVIPMMPAFEPIMSITNSGMWPVRPNTVVFKYRSCPARSMNVSTLAESWQIWAQSSLPSCPGLLTTSPLVENPRMSCDTEEVRPDSASCACRNSLCRLFPRPLSSSPCVSTPSRVLLPASTLPHTATRISWKSSPVGQVRTSTSATSPSLPLLVRSGKTSALSSAASSLRVARDLSSCSFVSPSGVPSSPRPTS